MEPDADLNPDKDDLPLRANTSHMLVRHYVLDMSVGFHRKVIGGSIVLFLEPVAPGPGGASTAGPGDSPRPGRGTQTMGGEEGAGFGETDKKTPAEAWRVAGGVGETDAASKDEAALQDDLKDEARVGRGVAAAVEAGTAEEAGARTRTGEEAAAGSATPHSDASWESSSDGDFTLVLDCCDLAVSTVEALDVASVPAMSGLVEEVKGQGTAGQSAALIQKLVSIPSGRWREQHRLFSQCSRAPASRGGETLRFHMDRWSLQVRQRGARTPRDFPRALRICYETRPEGRSVTWTRDQDNRVCVYTAGSPINNRALFACQEPPVAMATWQARVRAPSECVVLMSGENQPAPTEEEDTGLSIWDYYVTMPMPASTFTLAAGHWRQATAEFTAEESRARAEGRMECGETPARAGPGSQTVAGPAAGAGSSTGEVIKCSALQTGSRDQTGSGPAFCGSGPEGRSVAAFPDTPDESVCCSHGDYPCRFTEPSARSQRVVPHRVFAPDCLLQKAQTGVLSLLPRCLAAAHAVLGVHPFPRLDLLVVPAGFSSLGMASPHIVFLSQSVLCADGAGERGQALCGSRLCHELAHSWFGLAIGARDWTEEWISEGFATYLEDIIWARAQQLSPSETVEQCDLKALLRWRRLSDELHNSEEQLQVLRPNMENTGQVSESGSSVVKHALNPDKTFMQVHYLKGYFLLRFLGSQVGEQQFIDFFRLFVKKYHGQLILSQDFLRMLLATFPDTGRHGLTLSSVYAQWLDQPGIPKWLCERSAVWSQARLVDEVKAEVIKWIQLSRSQGKGRKRKKAEPKVNYKEVSSDQLLLLLELLLEEAELSVTSLRSLERTYCLQKQDAEVRHRWCELVVKHGLSQAYRDVEHFLVHDQAMGVYLYGELMVQEDPDQQALARRCLSLVREEMDQSARRVVEEMVL